MLVWTRSRYRRDEVCGAVSLVMFRSSGREAHMLAAGIGGIGIVGIVIIVVIVVVLFARR
jgi:hypothetical protein